MANLFGVLESGENVNLYTIKGKNTSAEIMDLGATLVKLVTFGTDVIGGFDSPADYIKDNSYQGATIGRVANRIENAEFVMDGKTYSLTENDNGNCLHGGSGFSYKIWDVIDHTEDSITLSYVSPDGEENYPGTLTVNVRYKLSQDNALSIAYRATTDKKTIVNMTNHVYFNLGGYASGKILDHVMWMDCDTFLPTDADLIPTGEFRSVVGTPFDFTAEKTIGKDFDLSYEPMAFAGGYDHCMTFRAVEDNWAEPKIKVRDPKSNREMVVYTDAPCVQFYSANFMKNPDYPFKGGYPQTPQNGFCLETQKMPDSINHPEFTDITLDVGEVYETKTVYKFLVD